MVPLAVAVVVPAVIALGSRRGICVTGVAYAIIVHVTLSRVLNVGTVIGSVRHAVAITVGRRGCWTDVPAVAELAIVQYVARVSAHPIYSGTAPNLVAVAVGNLYTVIPNTAEDNIGTTASDYIVVAGTTVYLVGTAAAVEVIGTSKAPNHVAAPE